MKLLNSIIQSRYLTSQFSGPLAFNFAGNAEEEAEAARKAEEEAAAAEAAKVAEEEEAAAEAAAEAEDEDPITAPNPFEEGDAQHQAFEKQREKFKQKLAKETEAARKGAEASLAGKMDELLKVVGGAVAPKKEEKPAPKGTKATSEDVEIVSDALRSMGLDPVEIVAERRRQEVGSALKRLAEENPNVDLTNEDERKALIKYANDTGISNMGGTPYDILQLALFRKYRASFTQSGEKPPPPVVKKKDPVHIAAGGSKSEPSPKDEKPTGGFAGWKKRIMSKHGGA